ncbi:MAG: HXXEE domain-containing protein [Solirubrobacterales bacterium]
MHQWVLWVLVAASALHVVEEHALGWQGWSSEFFGERLGIRPTWTDFWITNAALIVFGVACAMVGWKAAGFSLGLAALALINAIGFHILPSLRAGAPTPGLFTAVALYVPIGIWASLAAAADDRLSFGAFVLSALVGAAVMAVAVGMLILGRDYGYADAAEGEVGPPPIPSSGIGADLDRESEDGD